jgi:hypothetical protein
MKKLIPILCLILIFASCEKFYVGPYKSQGTITGYNLGACATCGGLEIVIKDDTAKNPPPFYRINKTLTQLGISENTNFPINVNLNWQRETGGTNSNFIIVSQIKVVN